MVVLTIIYENYAFASCLLTNRPGSTKFLRRRVNSRAKWLVAEGRRAACNLGGGARATAAAPSFTRCLRPLALPCSRFGNRADTILVMALCLQSGIVTWVSVELIHTLPAPARSSLLEIWKQSRHDIGDGIVSSKRNRNLGVSRTNPHAACARSLFLARDLETESTRYW
ncbi:hypothetical protein J6590_051684 [Homalodisca vitripennis]|nr:hypothetical protein J6590_051684 [Homalodisca vitripennis]